MKRWVPMVLLSITACATSASAASYLGASVMSTSAEFVDAAQSFDTREYTWKVFGGFTFVEFLGLEAAYRDLGSHEETDGTDSVRAELKAYDLNLRGILPLGKKVELYLKAGYAHIDWEGTFDIGGALSEFDESDWELMYGVGLDWTVGKHFGLRAEWELYDVTTDLDSVSVGAYWRF